MSKSLAKRIDAILQPWRDDEVDGATPIVIAIDRVIREELAPKQPSPPLSKAPNHEHR